MQVVGEQIQIRASHYWPDLGGINCSHFVNGHCTAHMANGKPWQSYINIAIACPIEMPFGTKIIVNNKTWICMDRGGKIIYGNDGIPWIDFLSESSPFDGYQYGAVFDAIIIYQ